MFPIKSLKSIKISSYKISSDRLRGFQNKFELLLKAVAFFTNFFILRVLKLNIRFFLVMIGSFKAPVLKAKFTSSNSNSLNI